MAWSLPRTSRTSLPAFRASARSGTTSASAARWAHCRRLSVCTWLQEAGGAKGKEKAPAHVRRINFSSSFSFFLHNSSAPSGCRAGVGLEDGVVGMAEHALSNCPNFFLLVPITVPLPLDRSKRMGRKRHLSRDTCQALLPSTHLSLRSVSEQKRGSLVHAPGLCGRACHHHRPCHQLRKKSYCPSRQHPLRPRSARPLPPVHDSPAAALASVTCGRSAWWGLTREGSLPPAEPSRPACSQAVRSDQHSNTSRSGRINKSSLVSPSALSQL